MFCNSSVVKSIKVYVIGCFLVFMLLALVYFNSLIKEGSIHMYSFDPWYGNYNHSICLSESVDLGDFADGAIVQRQLGYEFLRHVTLVFIRMVYFSMKCYLSGNTSMLLTPDWKFHSG